jgi:hypothetical protein
MNTGAVGNKLAMGRPQSAGAKAGAATNQQA